MNWLMVRTMRSCLKYMSEDRHTILTGIERYVFLDSFLPAMLRLFFSP